MVNGVAIWDEAHIHDMYPCCRHWCECKTGGVMDVDSTHQQSLANSKSRNKSPSLWPTIKSAKRRKKRKNLVKVQYVLLTCPTGGAFIKNGNLDERSSDIMSTSRAAQHCWMYQPESTQLQVKLTAKIFSEYGRTATMSNCFKFWLVPFYTFSACRVLTQLRAATEKKCKVPISQHLWNPRAELWLANTA